MGPKGVPYVVTHDGRTLRFPHPLVKTNDTIKLNLRTNEIVSYFKFDTLVELVLLKESRNMRVHMILSILKMKMV